MNVHSVAEVGEQPTELDKRRETIKSAVDAAANGVMVDIRSLRAQLDELESLVLQNAARVTESLNTHVGICEAAQFEVNRLSGIVAEMRKTQIDNISIEGGQR
jgi:hypothetical protein